MKRILFSSAAAIAVVVGLASFKEAKTIKYYFNVTASPSIDASVVTLSDNQVARRANPSTNPGDICAGADKLCIVSFLTSQLTAGKLHLNTGGTPIAFQTLISTKN
jgi:hypothetical protein